jgi:hypothetical protein
VGKGSNDGKNGCDRSLLLACASAAAATLAFEGPCAAAPREMKAVEPSNDCASSIDEAYLDVADRAARAAPKIPRVWSGYWPAQPPLIFYKPGVSALMISSAEPPAPFKPLATAGLPKALRGRAYYSCGALPGLAGNFSTDYGVGNIRAIAVKLESTTRQTLDNLFHEAFHKYQDTSFPRTTGADSIKLADENWLDPKIISDPAFVAGMELERRILARAISVGSTKAMAPLLRQYLAARQHRSRDLPTPVRHAELNIERKEGSASIVGSEAAAVAMGRDLRTSSEQLMMFMSEPPQSLPFGLSAFERFRARSFGSGAAIACILTRMGVDWRRKSQMGTSFETLLADAVKLEAESTPALLREASSRFGHAELLADAREWKATAGKEIGREDFQLTGKVRLTVEFPKLGSGSPAFRGAGSGIPAQPEKGLVIFLAAQALELDYEGISLRAEKRPYMLDMTRSPRFFSVSVTLDQFPRIEGHKNGAKQLTWNGGGTIEGPGLVLKIKERAVVDLADGSITVRVAP